eukprot:scaffold6324_cov158-Ochromonas_danica.AAC.6
MMSPAALDGWVVQQAPFTLIDYAMLCYAMLCYAMLCYAMLCYAMLSSPTEDDDAHMITTCEQSHSIHSSPFCMPSIPICWQESQCKTSLSSSYTLSLLLSR